ncbi:MAG: uracil-DNA glycosylase [Lentisphaeria bacterium]|nr:uracil-DNA glycosylase [Lentisphaeria bacterium]
MDEQLKFFEAFEQCLKNYQLHGDDFVNISEENMYFLREMAKPKEKVQKAQTTSAPVKQQQAYSKPQAQNEETNKGFQSSNLQSVLEKPKVETPKRELPPLNLEGVNWNQLKDLVGGCQRCELCHMGRIQTVFGAGNTDADLMFIGEGPGYQEDQQGIPFVGPAGDLLTKIIQAMKFTREGVYIANIVKCRPPNNRNPYDQEAHACLPYLKKQIQLVQPRIIVLLGSVPLVYMFNKIGIMKNRGKWLEFEGIPVMPTFHPAFLLRKQEFKREVWEDMKLVMEKFGD